MISRSCPFISVNVDKLFISAELQQLAIYFPYISSKSAAELKIR